MEELYKSIGKRIRETRQKTGMTIEQLATEIDMDWSFIGGIERGRNIPSIETLFKIANALRIPLSYLFKIGKPVIKEQNAKINRLLKLLKNKKPADIDLTIDIIEKIFKRYSPK
jgi:transcriptional regulator with XRE-family HTH domain